MSRWRIVTDQDFKKAETSFYKTLTKYLENSKRDVKKAVHVQFRGIVRNVLNITPPLYAGQGSSLMMGSRINWGQGRIQGQIRIRESMENVLRTLNENEERRLAKLRQRQWKNSAKAAAKQGLNVGTISTFNLLETEDREPLSWYLSIQPEHKRQKKLRQKDQLLVNRSQFLALEKEIFARQGYIPSGWKALMKRFGISVPAWVSRHNLRSSCVFVNTKDFYGFKAVNGTNARMSKQVQNRIAIAMIAQRNKIERQLANWAKTRKVVP